MLALGILMLMTVLWGCDMHETEDESVEITFAHFQGEGDAMYKSIQDAIRRFENDYPNVKIEQDYYPADAYSFRVEKWNEENQMRDITMILGINAQAYAENNSIKPLTNLVDTYGISTKILPQYFKEGSANGEIYAIPWEDASYGFIMYNQGIFDEAGVQSFPKTLDELEVASRKITEAGYVPMALGNKLLWPLDSILFSALVNNYVGSQWYDSILARDGNASFEDPQFIKALEALQRLGEMDLFNDNMNSLDNEQRGEMYQNRQAAMISAGNWECKSTTEVVPEVAEETKIALWPTENLGQSQSVVVSSAWGMAMGANIPEEKVKYAMIFISEYMCSTEFARIMAEEQGVYTPWDTEYDAITVDVITKQVEEVVEAEGVQRCLNWDSTLPLEVKKIYQQGLEDIVQGNTTPEILAANMERAYKKLFEHMDK